MSNYKQLGDILIRRKVLRSTELAEVLRSQRQTGRVMTEIIADLGFAAEEDIAAALAAEFLCPLVDLTVTRPDKDALTLIPADFALSHCILPLRASDEEFYCVISDRLDAKTTEWLRSHVNRRVITAFASRSKLIQVVHSAYASPDRVKKPLGVTKVMRKLARPPKSHPQFDRQALLDLLAQDFDVPADSKHPKAS